MIIGILVVMAIVIVVDLSHKYLTDDVKGLLYVEDEQPNPTEQVESKEELNLTKEELQTEPVPNQVKEESNGEKAKEEFRKRTSAILQEKAKNRRSKRSSSKPTQKKAMGGEDMLHEVYDNAE